MAPSLSTAVSSLLLLLLLAAAISVSSSPPMPEDSIRVISAEKRIDLTSPIVKVFLTLKLENDATAPEASQVLLAFTPTEVEHLAIVKATRAEGKRKKKIYVPLSVKASDLAAAPNGARLLPTSKCRAIGWSPLQGWTPPVELEFVRKVEISHWGNVQITEQYKLKHGGAQHKGVFSRLEYQSRPSISGVPSFKNLLARLPPRVHSVYYRDEIGNISSSHLRSDSHKSELEIEPRYPLFGGWHCTFTIGYGLPLQDFLFESDDGRRYINLTFGCPLLDTVVDDLTIKVVLPEGSTSPQAVVPFLTEQYLETSYSYLDVVGRTTVVLKKRNVVGEHNVPFQVYYEFNPIFMLAEPLMLISAVFLFFVACIAYLHMDLSIGKS
uniref:Dolichyl-diphosphooligosaccharide--protein glycosyltransferase subunit 1 n=1 Tax=Oryza rufipogon TaxID=4529 RepID=A0A0E0PG93_ORYRU